MRRAMTWVYCEPKSRIRIFECFGGAAVFTWLRVRLRDAVLARWIARLALFGSDLSLARNAALKLSLNFSTASLLERIGATCHQHSERCRKQDRQRRHPLLFGIKFANANRHDLHGGPSQPPAT